jgi:hypothetical protein
MGDTSGHGFSLTKKKGKIPTRAAKHVLERLAAFVYGS